MKRLFALCLLSGLVGLQAETELSLNLKIDDLPGLVEKVKSGDNSDIKSMFADKDAKALVRSKWDAAKFRDAVSEEGLSEDQAETLADAIESELNADEAGEVSEESTEEVEADAEASEEASS